MVRDLTKSLLSFSWSMSLFGMKQVTNVLSPQNPSQAMHKAAMAFDSVTKATEGQLGGTLDGVFKAGDQLQKGVVDLTLGFLSLEALNPSQMMRMTSDMVKQSTTTFGQTMRGGQSAGESQPRPWTAASPPPPAAPAPAAPTPAAAPAAPVSPPPASTAAAGWGPVN
jgi:hypothetical protein